MGSKSGEKNFLIIPCIMNVILFIRVQNYIEKSFKASFCCFNLFQGE